MKKNYLKVIAAFFALLFCTVLSAKSEPSEVVAAKGVVTRCFGFFPKNVEFKVIAKNADCDVYALSVTKGRLTVEGSSTVAICKGFHDYILSNGYGLVSWTGNRLDLPKKLPTMERAQTESPYQHHLYYNVCTFGYTTPFWGWKEWEKEIDWMAMHGFDMPLSPIGGETILTRVWKQFGLTDEEISDYFTGPAHFPWMRMGNIAHFQGGMSKEWFDAQIALEHNINDRELELGMTPVYQGFAGFVPKGITNHYPDLKLTETDWSSFDKSCLNHMLPPMHPLFSEMGTAFIKEWEKEFGKGKYYLIDSFNEMDIPFGTPGSQERFDALKKYGRMIYDSIRSADQDAVWVMQGWILGYQRAIWTPETLASLLSDVPDDKMLIIDLAVDFNQYVWKNSRTWDFYKGFYNKDWIWSTVPNFGGKSSLVGPIDFYLNDAVNALTSPNKGNLVGFGTSPEGVENNEITYEAISSSGWSSSKKDLMPFLKNYTAARYGAAPDALMNFWKEMLQSPYCNFTSRAKFNWQLRQPTRKPAPLNINDHYFRGIEDFLSVAGDFADNPLYEADAIMYGALYFAGQADEVLAAIYKSLDAGDTDNASKLESLLLELLSNADKLLESHPTMRTQRWMDFASEAGTNPEESKSFVINSKRLISTWGGASLHDYAARVWSGILRDYYVPRLRFYFDSIIAGGVPDMVTFDEGSFPVTATLSTPSTFENPVAAAVKLVSEFSTRVPEAIRVAVKAVETPEPDYSKAPGTLRIVTYNVGHFGKSGEDSSSDIAKMMSEIGADAIGLCELDSCTARQPSYQMAGFVSKLASESGNSGWDFAFQRAMPYSGGAYGDGIAVRGKIVDKFGVALPKGVGAESRGMSVVETPDYCLACVHLDHKSSDARLAQIRIASDVLEEKYGKSDKPVFLCGDFNDSRSSAVLNELKSDWKLISATYPTYDAKNPSICIDYILALNNKAKFSVDKSFVCTRFKSADVSVTSDHLPLFVDVVL